MRILDTHLHLIYPDRFNYDWTKGTPLDRPWTIEDYWKEAEPLGIESMLHMEVDVAARRDRGRDEVRARRPSAGDRRDRQLPARSATISRPSSSG